jgi:hypothetical protein
MTIEYSYGPAGNCPIQAEGYIGGHPFYFRSRGEYWTLYISPRKGDKEIFDPFTHDSWIYSEEYRGEVYRRREEQGKSTCAAAGWATPEECRLFIEKAAKMFLEESGK